MPPREECPHCRELILDWHIEWYSGQSSALFKGLAATDCPVCGQGVGFQGGRIGFPPEDAPIVRRSVLQAARWASSQAVKAGASLWGYLSNLGAGEQYANYWSTNEVRQADEIVRAD